MPDIAAFCSGRTVIPSDNPVRNEIAPIAANNELVKHSLLALTASYFLDFQKGSVIAETARSHHSRAVMILDQELRSLEWGVPGKEEAITAGLLLIILNEIINWEGTSGQRYPVWYRCGEVVRRILDNSDPGIKYRDPWNVQTSRARPQLAAMYTMHNVFSDCFYPLDLSAKRCPTPWLLLGSDLEQRQINGSIGASPKLMHYFAKITFLATKLYNVSRKSVHTYSMLMPL
jgi:Fungal specific transcription factor domain